MTKPKAPKINLSLKKRPAELGSHINGRTEKHGDDSVGACDLKLSKLNLERDELDGLLGAGTWERVFKKTRNSGMPDFPEPADFIEACALPFQVEAKFEESRVTLFMGIDNEDKVELAKCTLAKIKWEPISGGLTVVSLQVQCNPDPDQIAKIYKHMDTNIDASVRFGRVAADKDENQADLPLKANGNGAKTEETRAEA